MRGSKGQSVQGLKGQSDRVLTRIAGEDLVPATPHVRVRHGVGVHAPADDAPARVHRPENAGRILDVKDIGVSVCEQRTAFAVLLHFHERKEFGERGLGLFLAAEFLDERSSTE